MDIQFKAISTDKMVNVVVIIYQVKKLGCIIVYVVLNVFTVIFNCDDPTIRK